MCLLTWMTFLLPLAMQVMARDTTSQDVCISAPNFDRNCLHRLYGTKTTYKNAREMIKRGSPVMSVIPETCYPVSLYMFKRHGIRYPDREDISKMEETLSQIRDEVLVAASQGRTSLCNSDVEALRRWQIRMIPDDDNMITPSGEKEIAEIGQYAAVSLYFLDH